MRLIPGRLEAVDAGTMKLAGTRIKIILEKSTELLIDKIKYIKMANAINTYWWIGFIKIMQRVKMDFNFLGS